LRNKRRHKAFLEWIDTLEWLQRRPLGWFRADEITPEQVARARNTRPEELRRQLQGDLDTIVMMALRKEPQRRYASGEEFANDIERHLSGRPVLARKPTLLYRSGKFLRRHRESFAAVAIVFVLMAGLGAWQARRVWKQNVAAQPSASVRFRARPSLAVMGFKNLSGRSDTVWLSTALSELLSAELAAGEQLRIVPGETVAHTKIDLGLSDVESIRTETLAQIRKNLGSDFIILGSYLDSGKENGSPIRIDLRLQDDAKGETVATVSETGTEATVIDLALQIGARLRDQLGLRKLSQVESAAVTAELPSSPEALRLYSQGLGKQRSFDALKARELLSRAVAIDPSFPLAHSALATAWLALGYDANGQQEAKKALARADKLSREDQLLVQGRRNWFEDKYGIERHDRRPLRQLCRTRVSKIPSRGTGNAPSPATYPQNQPPQQHRRGYNLESIEA
jgi:TolB-like protein